MLQVRHYTSEHKPEAIRPLPDDSHDEPYGLKGRVVGGKPEWAK